MQFYCLHVEPTFNHLISCTVIITIQPTNGSPSSLVTVSVKHRSLLLAQPEGAQ